MAPPFGGGNWPAGIDRLFKEELGTTVCALRQAEDDQCFKSFLISLSLLTLLTLI
jgi:hypothetical protein